MAWSTDMVLLLRTMVNDLDSLTYTNSRLEQHLAAAAFQVCRELTFNQTYTITLSTPNISPDPTADATREDAFTNLVTIKAACNLDRGAALVAANRAIAVKDGTSSVDLRGIAQEKIALLREGWCAVYKDAKTEYLQDQSGVSRTGATLAGTAILSPFRYFARQYYPDAPAYGLGESGSSRA